MGLHGMNALVTGGGSGLGLACAHRLARDGATVTLAGRSEERLRAAAEDLRRSHPAADVRLCAADVIDDAAVSRAVEVAADGAGLHVVVASAGTGWIAPIATIPLAAWRSVLDVNLHGNFLTLRHAAPAMRAAGGGAYTAISSVAAVLPWAYHAAYATAKAATDALVRSAAVELGPFGIRVNSVQPGLVPSDLTADITNSPLTREFLDNQSISRMGTPDDVAALVHFLSGSEAGWITGACIPVDGGHHLQRAPRADEWVRADQGTAWLPDG